MFYKIKTNLTRIEDLFTKLQLFVRFKIIFRLALVFNN